MRELRTEVEIHGSPDQVWGILTDLESFAEWNPFIRKARGVVQVGERLEIEIEPPGGKRMKFSPTVRRAAPGRELRWLGRLLLPGLFDGEHIFEISSTDNGVTRLVHREEFGGLLVPLVWGSMSSQTREGFQAMNAALKKRVEGSR